MAIFTRVVFSMLFLLACANTAEITLKDSVLSTRLDKRSTKNIDRSEKFSSKEIKTDNVQENGNERGQSQNRGYNFDQYPTYPYYSNGNDPSTNGVYRPNDPLVQIHERLDDIASIVRQTTLPPVSPATRYPLFVPFVTPYVNCPCLPKENERPYPQPVTTKENKPPLRKANDRQSMNISIPNRTSLDFVDESENPGSAEDESLIEDDDDFTRPISFDPLPPIKGIHKIPPPVEHGSVQADINSKDVLNTQFLSDSILPEKDKHENIHIDISSNRPLRPTTTTTPFINRDDQYRPNSGAPTVCDGAVLACCHQTRITYGCFATHGCRDPSSVYKSPCDINVILTVIERFQKFYRQKSG